MTLGLAIPCTKSYINYLENLLENISKQTVIPDEISISISEMENYYPTNDYGLNLIITTTIDKKNGAENRNIASSKLNTDIVSFMDCDDLMHPQRTEFIKESFVNDIDGVVHDFEISHNCSWKTIEFPLDEFLNVTYENMDFKKDVIDSIVSGSLYPNNVSVKYVYHNAHVSVKKELLKNFTYDTTHTFPDSIFNRSLIENGYKLSYISNKLSYYDLKW